MTSCRESAVSSRLGSAPSLDVAWLALLSSVLIIFGSYHSRKHRVSVPLDHLLIVAMKTEILGTKDTSVVSLFDCWCMELLINTKEHLKKGIANIWFWYGTCLMSITSGLFQTCRKQSPLFVNQLSSWIFVLAGYGWELKKVEGSKLFYFDFATCWSTSPWWPCRCSYWWMWPSSPSSAPPCFSSSILPIPPSSDSSAMMRWGQMMMWWGWGEDRFHLFQDRFHLFKDRFHLFKDRFHPLEDRFYLLWTDFIFLRTDFIFLRTDFIFLRTDLIFLRIDFIYLLETANFDHLLIEVNPPPLPRLNNQHRSQHDHKVRDRWKICVAKLLKLRNTLMIEIYFFYSYGFPLVLILIKGCSVRSLLDSFKVLMVIFFW